MSIVFLGDSLSENNNWSINLSADIANHGVGGNTTWDILCRLNLSLLKNPRKLFFMAGINDMWRGISNESIADTIEEILRQIKVRNKLTQVFVQSVLPVNLTLSAPGHAKTLTNLNIKKLNKIIEVRTSSQQFKFLNLFDNFTSAEGQLHPELTEDGVHLNKNAYRVWESLLQNQID